MKSYQPLLMPLRPATRPLTPSEHETLRRYGSLEVRGVAAIRRARERKAHEARKNAPTLDLRGVLKHI